MIYLHPSSYINHVSINGSISILSINALNNGRLQEGEVHIFKPLDNGSLNPLPIHSGDCTLNRSQYADFDTSETVGSDAKSANVEGIPVALTTKIALVSTIFGKV